MVGLRLAPFQRLLYARNALWGSGVDWSLGYGYQFWICRLEAYRGDGVDGQFCIVIPRSCAVIAITAQERKMQAILDAAGVTILPLLQIRNKSYHQVREGAIMTTVYLVRHGEVYNPAGVVYGSLPGFGLSEAGQAQIEQAAEALAEWAPFHALYASPLQRAQESATILAGRLGLEIETEEAIVETGIGEYQGQPLAALPHPYITEIPTHDGIEAAMTIRSRMLGWVKTRQAKHPGQSIVAVSHRDPIIITLLHWMRRDLTDLPDFDLPPGAVYAVELKGSKVSVERIV